MNVLFVLEALDFGVEEVEPFCGAENRACDENILVTAAAHVDDDSLVAWDLFCELHCGGSCVG